MKGTWSQLRVALGFITFTIVSIVYLMANDQLGQLQVVQVFAKQLSIRKSSAENSEWLVDGPHCRIRNINPFHPSIQQYLGITSPVVCSTILPLTNIVRSSSNQSVAILTINQSLIGHYKIQNKHRIECCWSTITRTSQEISNYNHEADTKYRFSGCAKFQDRIKLSASTEFVHVKCQSIAKKMKRGKIVYENMHAIATEKRPKSNHDAPAEQHQLNVIIIGIDSVSRLSLRRTMPATLDYLTSNSWIEMNGYNKIADNTFPNLMAILSGRTVNQIHNICLNERIPIMDNCPSLFKDYSNNGYLTSYAEDVPSLSTFNYKMNGFVQQPTDYYMRPFMLAAHAQLTVRNKDGLPICIGPQSAADVMFDYAHDIVSTNMRKNVPHFGLFWLNSFSHNDVNAPAALDLRLLRFLRQLDQIENVYNNTMIIILSDHGIRFGKIRNAFLGFLEERLPFLFFHLPQWFLNRYPDAYKNLLSNQHRLTSPYDLHMTLNSLLQGGKSTQSPACPKCHSLFEAIPLNRTCADAGIDPHWCTCPNFAPVSVDDPLVKQVGQFLFQRILNRTHDLILNEKAPLTLCEQRKFNEILRVHKSSPISQDQDQQQEETKQVYVIVIETEPLALFEATVSVDLTKGKNVPQFQVIGFISRLDSYFATSKCVQSKMLQFYCHCTLQ